MIGKARAIVSLRILRRRRAANFAADVIAP